MPAKFITAPDKIREISVNRKKVLIIDAEWVDIEPIAMVCMTRNIDMDFLIFPPTGIVTEWLDDAIDVADTILFNHKSTRLHINDDHLLMDNRTKEFGGKNCKYATPLDYIVETIDQK